MSEQKLICEECGSPGEGGELEYSDGTRRHFRNPEAWKDGKAHPVMCSGRLVPIVDWSDEGVRK